MMEKVSGPVFSLTSLMAAQSAHMVARGTGCVLELKPESPTDVPMDARRGAPSQVRSAAVPPLGTSAGVLQEVTLMVLLVMMDLESALLVVVVQPWVKALVLPPIAKLLPNAEEESMDAPPLNKEMKL